MLPVLAAAAGMGLASGIGSYYANKANSKALTDAYNKIQAASENNQAVNQAEIDKYKSLIDSTYGTGASNYETALNNFLNSDVYQNDPFSYDKTVDEFMDPYANQRVQAAMDAINNSAASGGNRFSSDYINRVGAKQQSLASEEWEKAYNKLQSDRQNALNEYNANATNAWNNYNATNARNQYAVDAYGNDRNSYVNGLGDAMTATMNNNNAALQTQAQVLSGIGQANQNNNWGSALLNGLSAGANFLGSYYGGR